MGEGLKLFIYYYYYLLWEFSGSLWYNEFGAVGADSGPAGEFLFLSPN